MHVHSKYSDSFSRIPVILKVARHQNIGISITDHNEIRGAVQAAQQKNIFTIPGIEITCSEGTHILAYFYTINDLQHFFKKYIRKNRSKNPTRRTSVPAQVLLDYLDTYTCITVAAHPTFPSVIGLKTAIDKRILPRKILKQITAIEALSGTLTKNMNQRAILFAQQLGKPVTGGSDAHTVGVIGGITTSAQATTTDEFLDAIKKNENQIEGTPTKIHKQMVGIVHGLVKHTMYATASLI